MKDESRPHTTASLDTLFELLADRRRRYVLYYLQMTSGDAVIFDELATRIATWETSPETEPTEDRLENVKIELQHKHLPKLEDHGIVDYDARSETIRYWDDLASETWLERARADEFRTAERSESRSNEEIVTTALKSTLKAAYDTDVELTRSFSCATDPSYPDWSVKVSEVEKPLEDT